MSVVWTCNVWMLSHINAAKLSSLSGPWIISSICILTCCTLQMIHHLFRRQLSSAASIYKPLPIYSNLPQSWSVIGGAGMLGKTLVDYLLEAGAKSVKVGLQTAAS